MPDIQMIAREILALVGVDVPECCTVQLTDGDDTGDMGFTYRVNVGQVEAAAEEHRLTLGETIDVDALIAALPWAPPWA